MNTLFAAFDLIIRATIVLAVAAIVITLPRRVLSASGRHAIWLAAIVGTMLLPTFMLLGQAHRIVIPSRFFHAAAAPKSSATLAQPAAVPVQLSLSDPPPIPNKAFPPRVVSIHAAPAGRIEAPWAEFAARPAQEIGGAAPGVLAQSAMRRVNWPLAILSLWAAITALLIARLATSLVLTNRMTRLSQPAGIDFPEAQQRGIAIMIGKPELGAVSPMTWGILHPVILLPAAAATWPGERRRAALLHEMAHIIRRDWLLQTFAQVACAVYWFHPLVWLAARRMRTESEASCDDMVVTRGGVDPADYARHLLDIARSIQSTRLMLRGSVAMAQSGGIESRLRAVLAERIRRSALSGPGIAAIAVATFLLIGITSTRMTIGSPEPGFGTSANYIPMDARPTVSDVRGSAARFPNDVAVSVIGICEPRSLQVEHESWWSPDGSLLPRYPLATHMRLDPKVLENVGPDDRVVTLAVRMNTPKRTGPAGLPMEIEPLAPGTACRVQFAPESPDLQSLRLNYLVSAIIPRSTQSIGLKVDAQDYKIHDVVVWKSGGANTASAQSWSAEAPGAPALELHSSKTGVTATTTLDIGQRPDYDLYQGFIAVGLDGKTYSKSSIFGYSSRPDRPNARHYFTAFAVPLADVREFRMQMQVHHWQRITVNLLPEKAAGGVAPTGSIANAGQVAGTQSDPQLLKLVGLRAKLIGWAGAHRRGLTQMANSAPGDLPAMMPIYESLNEYPIAFWGGNVPGGAADQIPPIAFCVPRQLTLSHLRRSSEAIDKRIRQDFASRHDFRYVETLPYHGGANWVLWASGRITQVTIHSVRQIGHHKPLLMFTTITDVIPPFGTTG